MSNKVKIMRIEHTGNPVCLDRVVVAEKDTETVEYKYSTDGFEIARAMCDGYRFRFNQHRSLRKRYGDKKDENGHTVKDDTNLIPLGDTVSDFTDAQARKEFPFLSFMPSMVLHAAGRKENQDWNAAIKRRNTKKKQGKNPGKMPRFKSRKTADLRFVCYRNNGNTTNAVFTKTGKSSGFVEITGKNYKGMFEKGKSRWGLRFHIRIPKKNIPAYTSVHVNLTDMTLVFVNEPQPLTRTDTFTGVGIDRGGVISAVDSDGEDYTPRCDKLQLLEKRATFYQTEMSKMCSRAEKKDGKEHMYKVMKGRKYRELKEKFAFTSERIANIKRSENQKNTTRIIQNTHFVVLEDLPVASMTRKGGRRKRGMNRSFLQFSPSQFASFLEYKTFKAGGLVVYVNPSYTSQRCSECGYTGKENRESQAVFRCRDCGFSCNADTNAAKNIYQLGCVLIEFYADDIDTILNSVGVVDTAPVTSQGVRLKSYSWDKLRNGNGLVIRLDTPSEVSEDFYRRERTGLSSRCDNDSDITDHLVTDAVKDSAGNGNPLP